MDSESRRLFWRAAILLPALRLSLRFRGYKRTFAALQKKLEAREPAVPGQSASNDGMERSCRMIRAAIRYLPVQCSCLEESLTLWYLLRTQGIQASLRIGVRKENAKFEAHAWVEHDGAALNEPEAAHRHYAAFAKEFAEPPAGTS